MRRNTTNPSVTGRLPRSESLEHDLEGDPRPGAREQRKRTKSGACSSGPCASGTSGDADVEWSHVRNDEVDCGCRPLSARSHTSAARRRLGHGRPAVGSTCGGRSRPRSAISRSRATPGFTPFSRDWGRLYSNERAPTQSSLPPDLGSVEQGQHRRWTNVVSLAATLLDDEPVEATSSIGWAESMQRFTDWLATEETEQPLRLARTNLAFFRGSLGNESRRRRTLFPFRLAQLHDWNLNHHSEDVDRSPMLGLFREVMRQKLSTATTTWRQNDLTDLMYLSCGAGYADVIVGERQVTGLLNSGAKRLGPIASSLPAPPGRTPLDNRPRVGQ